MLCNFIEIALRNGCSPVNLLHIFRTPFLKNFSGWLLLQNNYCSSEIYLLSLSFLLFITFYAYPLVGFFLNLNYDSPRLYKSFIKGALSGLVQFLATESPLQMVKNAFKILKFLSWLFGHAAKQLDKKDQVNFKFYDVTTWLNISRSEGNQTMKFGQLIECSMRDIS